MIGSQIVVLRIGKVCISCFFVLFVVECYKQGQEFQYVDDYGECVVIDVIGLEEVDYVGELVDELGVVVDEVVDYDDVVFFLQVVVDCY